MRFEFYMNNFEYLGSAMINDIEKHQYYKITDEDSLEILHTIIKNDIVLLNFFKRENTELVLDFSITLQKDSKSNRVQNFLNEINNTVDIFYKENNVDGILKEINKKIKIQKLLLLDYYNYSQYLYTEILTILKNSNDTNRIKYLFYLVDTIKEKNEIYKSSNTKIDFIETYKSIMRDEVMEGLKDCFNDSPDDIAHIKTYNSILRKRKIEKLLK